MMKLVKAREGEIGRLTIEYDVEHNACLQQNFDGFLLLSSNITMVAPGASTTCVSSTCTSCCGL